MKWPQRETPNREFKRKKKTLDFGVREGSKWIDLAIPCRNGSFRGHQLGWWPISNQTLFSENSIAIWETSGRTEAEEASGGQISYYVPHSRTECKSSFLLFILRGVFGGQITKHCKLQAKMLRGIVNGAGQKARPLIRHRENPYR